MIYIIYTEIVLKNEHKDDFIYFMKKWVDMIKKQPLNLSFDLCWKNEKTIIVVQRWSNQNAYNSFIKSEFGKKISSELESFVEYTSRVEKLNTTL
ncbi:putative quinol monooxygenase [Mycoplasma tauri]|uniref:ABM domain-containing protein n=1 Tax=Mycoplasma tauri TaxID=547987 RepID=A0A953NCC4_9MOLU|nr:hypothetical protein [Mycoplasma tauri]MBZ4195261.1 hypothetical protein [Mycoplasma tauri]MBZ4204176.1 hypothetical protein [Mycoplasma tauri]